MTTPQGMLTDEEIGTLHAAVENLRSPDKAEERTIEAAWRIAFKLEQIAKRAHTRQAAAPQGREALIEQCAKIAQELDPDGYKCVHGHDRCEYGPDDECPYCEHDSPIARAIRAITPAVAPDGTGETREPTPHWERRWAHDGPNGWNLDCAGFLTLVQANPMLWLALGRAKYLELRVDTRDGAFNLYDRDKKPLNPDDVVAAAEKIKSQYGDANPRARQAQEPGEDKR